MRRSYSQTLLRGLGGKVLRSLVITVLALGVGELVARQVVIPDARSAPEGGDGILLKGSPWLLWELVPGIHEELGVTVQINSEGLRGPGRGPARPRRAIALGDSSVYGFGVEDGEVFTTLLEGRWGAEVLNAAVPGYSSSQSWNWFQMRGIELAPELLLVGSLWSDNNFDSFVDEELLADFSAWEGTFAARLGAGAQASALFRLLDWHLRVAPRAAYAAKVGWTLGATPPPDGARRVPINSYAANLEAFCRRMYQRGGGVAFVALANREDLSPTAEAAWYPYRDAMRLVASRWSAPIIELGPMFRESGLGRDSLFLDQMHPTATGHRILADGIAATLATWPDQPVRLQAPASPLPVFTDPFRPEVAELVAIEGDLVVPAIVGADVPRLRIELWEDGVLLGIGGRIGGGPFRLYLRELPERASFRVSADHAPDGPSPADRAWAAVEAVPVGGRWRVSLP